ncbi:hypothetical protein Q4W49_001719 [Salmonella enterica]|uniref:Uncharacterized protein n=1 Tax=Salmonella enterica TaxID=28901 RepID=A0A5V3WKW7_SALER|nr:hypothetical protein [Salmonella enterica]EBW7491641.1 hypothetical protein [Salmonella enterica subsp. enterica serovar Enteritidis]ECR4402647.1 hypothetical protein [Salmonella enterica subsp. enterica serovar Ona]EDP8617631.1 hypothetical protein [Salmonella enterica subsp. enterica]EDZ3587984.1 hypothetical protein [Salmonella enterica subsp. enterica serovar Wagenia]EEM8339675.1 hypothetical protein [Salmonella enterica subsp. enterica serovar Amager]
MHNQLQTFTVTIPVSPDFTGRILVKLENGVVKSTYTLDQKERVASLQGFLELAEMAGFKVIPPAA